MARSPLLALLILPAAGAALAQLVPPLDIDISKPVIGQPAGVLACQTLPDLLATDNMSGLMSRCAFLPGGIVAQVVGDPVPVAMPSVLALAEATGSPNPTAHATAAALHFTITAGPQTGVTAWAWAFEFKN